MTKHRLVVNVKHLNKSFAGKPAVINLDLTVKEGEICGFLGPNGSGKTTTLRMICGLLIPDSGEGHCLGFDILSNSYAIKRHVGYMTQSFSLYNDLTVYENLNFIARVYGLTQRRKRVQACLEKFELTHQKNQLAGTLSGGWKQRLALASCLLHEPKLLLLDEPTAGVDPQARRDFWDIIHSLANQGITTLVSTHYMDEAERCTRLAYIANGVLLTEGTPDEIIQHSQLSTWSVSGKRLLSLSEKLKLLPAINQVAFFGNRLHVSGMDPVLLEQAIEIFKDPDWHWRKISPSLEDVFIHLVDKEKK